MDIDAIIAKAVKHAATLAHGAIGFALGLLTTWII